MYSGTLTDIATYKKTTLVANLRVPSRGQPARQYASRGIKAKDEIFFGRTEAYKDDLLLPLNMILWHPSYKCTSFLTSESNIQNLFHTLHQKGNPHSPAKATKLFFKLSFDCRPPHSETDANSWILCQLERFSSTHHPHYNSRVPQKFELKSHQQREYW